MLKNDPVAIPEPIASALPDLSRRPEKLNEAENLAAFRKIPPSERPFAYAPEEVSANFPVDECQEGFTDLAALFVAAKVPAKFIPEEGAGEFYGGDQLLLRTSVALKVLKAAMSIQEASGGTLTIMVNSAHRPAELQHKYFNSEWKDQEALLSKTRPTGMTDDQFRLSVWQEVTKYVADPRLHPPHLSGGALDLTLVRNIPGFPEVDMGTPINEGDHRCNTWQFEGLSPEHIAAREFMYSHLRAAGLVNLSTEWWHWSDGDGYAAVFNDAPKARFDSKTAAEAVRSLVPAADLLPGVKGWKELSAGVGAGERPTA